MKTTINPPANNSFFTNNSLDFDAAPFTSIKTEDYIPALQYAIDLAKERIEGIKNEPTLLNFENTILALETSSEELDRISGVYFNLFAAEASPELQALAQTISPMMSNFSSDLLMDAGLFKRIKSVYENEFSKLENIEQKKLLENNYKSFVRNGALLNEEQKKQLKKIDEELSTLNPKYAENILKDTNSFSLHLTEKEELNGLPETTIEAARIAAKEKELSGWIFTLDAPSYIPFMAYSENRPLREKLWRAFNSRSTSGETNNQEFSKKIATLRFQRAQLLGYSSHAEFVLEERMAETPKKVHDFLQSFLDSSKSKAVEELNEVQKFQKDPIMPWDFSFYSEKLKKEKFNFSSEELRPYFNLENVINGAFEHAHKLYNLNFKENNSLDKYHPDVKIYEVYSLDNSFVGLFYTDFFPRATKQNGAWATSYAPQGLRGGKVERPHISIVCNFTKPTTDTPSLLTLDEVETLFHEFGHALHGLLSQCQYCSLSGTSVFWDFVELPSQINENWVLEKETLELFAKHYKTGEMIPDELIKKIKDAASFQAGYSNLRQVSFALLDMAWHDKDPSSIQDIEDFENQEVGQSNIFPKVDGAIKSTSFSHIFAGGYSAGYYSYKWAEVLDADAFELFKEKGVYNKEVADSFRKNILERGGSEHPMELYKRFRGREPDPKALLKRNQLI